jgi:hypothetical protein
MDNIDTIVSNDCEKSIENWPKWLMYNDMGNVDHLPTYLPPPIHLPIYLPTNLLTYLYNLTNDYKVKNACQTFNNLS